MGREPTDAWTVVGWLATWQFHDREHFITLFEDNRDTGMFRLQVCSTNPCNYSGVVKPHMTISPFAAEDMLAPQILQLAMPAVAEACAADPSNTCIKRELRRVLAEIASGVPAGARERSFIANLRREIDQAHDLERWLEGKFVDDPAPRDIWVAALQPLIDWLITYHPDFMRLNDFSEAFTLMRWARSVGLNAAAVHGPTQEQAPAVLPPPNAVELSEEIVAAKILSNSVR
jgi:hypothetical protein